ncbi:MAG: DUF4399 domain-containing protein [Acidimicrobiales bacterium]
MLGLAVLAAGCRDADNQQPAMSGVPQEAEAEAATAPTASFTVPDDEATVARRFSVAMAADGVEIEPAGEVRDGAGHFHVMVDTDCVEAGEAIPKDDEHLHFGGGQLEAQLFLEAGEHELCLQVADGAHVALPITDEITVTVDDEKPYVTLEVPEGESVASPLTVTMAAKGVTIEPAGEVIEGAGHFHVMVDTDCVKTGEVIPNDEGHLHFGDGSTTAELTLPPGEHSLCLQLGDGAHAALAPTHTVKVTVS